MPNALDKGNGVPLVLRLMVFAALLLESFFPRLTYNNPLQKTDGHGYTICPLCIFPLPPGLPSIGTVKIQGTEGGRGIGYIPAATPHGRTRCQTSSAGRRGDPHHLIPTSLELIRNGLQGYGVSGRGQARADGFDVARLPRTQLQ